MGPQSYLTPKHYREGRQGSFWVSVCAGVTGWLGGDAALKPWK